MAGLELQPGDETPAIKAGERIVTRDQLKSHGDRLVAYLQSHRIRRALVCSDDPLHLLRAIDACTRARSDLYIAHTYLSEAHLREITASCEIELLIGSNDTLVRTGTQPDGDTESRLFLMTSGTTGLPKIATHTLDTLLSRIRAGASFPANRCGKWLLTYQPTGFAGIQVQLTALFTGGTIVAPAQRTPSEFYAAARDAGVTQISATPTFWRSFLMVAVPSEIPLRQITLGGEAADQATLDRLRKAFPSARITHTYASTEAGVVYAVHDGIEGFPVSWIEQPNMPTQLRIREGLLQIKTANAMRGYANQVQQPLREDGWMTTSDRCEIRGDRVIVLGRDDSTINVGGSKVYPLMIETFLLRQPGVVEARVFGVPNPISGALVGAEVVLAAGLDPTTVRASILAACREALAGHQVPRVFKVVAAIKVASSGKKG